MGCKKILIIGPDFFPLISPRSFRTTELAKEMANTGNFVTIITKKKIDLHDEFEKKHNVIIKDIGTIYSDVKEGEKISFTKKVFLKILFMTGISPFFDFPHFLYMFKVIKALKKEDNYDLLISIAMPHSIHWGVAYVINKKKSLTSKWIADCGDPFMGNPFHKKAFFFKYLEMFFCKKADYITVPVKEAISAYYPEFKRKIKVIPQGFNFEKDREYISDYRVNKVPTFAYAGVFYENKRDPRQLLSYLNTLTIDFKFIIYSKSISLLTPYVLKSKGKIVLKDYIPRNQLLSELSTMDFLININNVGSVQSPSKLIDYYLSNRPVLTIENGKFSPELMDSFIVGNYINSHKFSNMNEYDIRYVSNAFLTL
jgi:hypothetical protein